MTMNERWGWIPRMTSTKSVVLFALCFILAGVAARPAQGQTFTVLHSFTDGSDGANPEGALIQDSTGNLYGTASGGGEDRSGVVYEISTAGTETVLYSFKGGKDGAGPTTSLVRDREGNLYGAALIGGSDDYGTIFRIDASGKEEVLHSFGSIKDDGCYPAQGLVMGESGVLFGTTAQCGSHNRGTIFKVDGARNFTILHSSIQSPDGGRPYDGHLTMDKLGNLYGLTTGGGHNQGVVYKLSRDGRFSLLHSFKGGTEDGCNPYGSVMQDQAGNLYGTTPDCGSNGYGVIWKLSKTGKETILHNFAGGTEDGCQPRGGLTRDSQGNFYGVTYECGTNDYGALYELSASGTYTVLHSFDESDGADSTAEVLWTTSGTLYGAAQDGGAYGWGTMWEYVP